MLPQFFKKKMGFRFFSQKNLFLAHSSGLSKQEKEELTYFV
jgi:hypothetical protein